MDEAIEVARDFHAAFEARDEQRFAALVADDVEIVNPLGTIIAVGRDAALDWLRQNEADGVHVTPAGAPELQGMTVIWPMTLRIPARGVERAGTGFFHVRDGRIARFEPTTRLPLSEPRNGGTSPRHRR